MQGSINFDGSLVGNITGGGGGGGDEIIITPVFTSGTKIADVSVNGVEKDLYCPNPTAVSVTQVQQSGTKIATIGVNGVNTDIYTPEGGGSDVEITPVVTSGTKIADVSVGGVEKDLYAPNYGADITALDGRLDTAEGNITNLAGHMTEAETDITEIKQSLSQLDGLIIYKDLTPTDDYAEFNDGSNLPLISLISTIEPIQSGSGTPSPDNPRPISGHTDIDIIVSPNSDFSGGTTYPVNFVDGGNPLTVYGGTLDVISGVLTVDRVSVNLGTLSWSYSTPDVRFFTTNIIDIKKVMDPSMVMNGLCSHYDIVAYGYVHGSSALDYVMGLFSTSTTNYLAIKDSRYTDATSFRTAMNGVQLVYELQTPQTYQLTHTEVHSLLGQNYISSDVGDITNVKYLGVLNLS